MEPQNTQTSFFQRNKTLLIVLFVGILIVGWTVSKYNNFIQGNETVDAQWAQVENQYKRRFDLIPNLVNTVKGVAKQEQEVFGMIADARTKYAGAVTTNEKVQAASQMETALARLLVVVENYPTLQSSGAYRDLMTQLEGAENRISVERMKYNDLVRGFNTNVKTFPTSLLAKMFGFGEKEYFEVPGEQQEVPQVQF